MSISLRTLAAAIFLFAPLAANATESVGNDAVEGLTFTERHPLATCKSVECYGIGALRRAFELGRLDSVVMYKRSSCNLLNEGSAAPIPCSVDPDAPGSFFRTEGDERFLVQNCHSLACFGKQVMGDLAERKLMSWIELPKAEDCRMLIFEIGRSVPCYGRDQASPIRPSGAEEY